MHWWVLNPSTSVSWGWCNTCLVFQRPPARFCGLFRIQPVSWKGNQFGLSVPSFSLDLGPQSLQLCLCSPMRPQTSVGYFVLQHSPPAWEAHGFLQPLALYLQSASASTINDTEEVQLTSLQLPFAHNLGPCQPAYSNRSLMSLNRFFFNSAFSLSSVIEWSPTSYPTITRNKSLVEFFHCIFNLL